VTTHLSRVIANGSSAVHLSIVIVNWNSRVYLQNCIASIEANPPDVPYEIIVIDSGSFDGCAEMLRRLYPWVHFHQSTINVGFGRANNLAASHARGDVLLFLNPDTEVHPGALTRLYSRLLLLSAPGALGCRLLNSDGSLQTSCVQSLPTILNQALDTELLRRWFPRSRLLPNAAIFPPGSPPMPVEAVSGACLMIRRARFVDVGGFSADYFMYGEDLDLCFKLRCAGLRNYHVPDAIVVHHGGGSTQHTKSTFSTVMIVESVNHLLRKSRGPVYSASYRSFLTSIALVRLMLLCLLWPLPSALQRYGGWLAVWRKWFSILRWGLGLERWIKRYRNIDYPPARATAPLEPLEHPCVGSVES
jgi:GT2 family glycosyltransferase